MLGVGEETWKPVELTRVRLGKPQKSAVFSGPATKWGGGGRAWKLIKNNFL